MAGRADPPLEQHNIEIRSNAEAWSRKPVLRRIYAEFYRLIAAQLATGLDAPTLELGSGIGAIKEHLPDCITSDLFPNPWLDRVENAYALQFGDGSLANIILFDVWHHLRYPGAALEEWARVLKPGGRVVIFDPAMGLAGRLIYGVCHHEPLGLGRPLPWQAAPDARDRDTYYAAQANCWRMFVRRERADSLPGWQIKRVQTFSALRYVASGGFRGPQLYPSLAYPLLGTLERLLDALPGLFATRMLVTLERCPAR